MSGYEGAVPGARPSASQAAAELGGAVTRTAEALQAIPVGDEAAAYSCLRDLDRALAGLAELLAAVPRVARLGDPAPAVRERLERSRTELAARRADLATYRTALDGLAETEKQLEEVTTQSRQLRDRITELERVQQTAAEIPGLRARSRELEQEIKELDAADAAEVSARLAAALGRLASVTEGQRAAMSETAASMAARAETAARELQELEQRKETAAAELAKLEGEAEQLVSEHRDTLPVLAAWSQADHDLAQSLRAAMVTTDGSALEGVTAELNGIRQRLTELDEVLGPLLAEHTRAYEQARQARPL